MEVGNEERRLFMYLVIVFYNQRKSVYEVFTFNTKEERDDYYYYYVDYYESYGYKVIKAKEE